MGRFTIEEEVDLGKKGKFIIEMVCLYDSCPSCQAKICKHEIGKYPVFWTGDGLHVVCCNCGQPIKIFMETKEYNKDHLPVNIG